MIQLYNDSDESAIFDMIFDRVAKQLTDDNCKMLNDFLDLCTEYQNGKQTQNDTLLNIGVIAVVQLSKTKKAKEYFDKFRVALLAIIRKYFASKWLNKEKNEFEFVVKTLSAFVIILKTLISKTPDEVDDQLVEITKKYLRNSVSKVY